MLSNVDLEKACGLDEIPSRMLKEGAKILAKPISRIFKVRPIFKKGENTEPKYYRPVSLLSVMY